MEVDLALATAEPAIATASPSSLSAGPEIWRIPQGRYVDAVRWMPPATAWHHSLAVALWDSDSGIVSLEVSSLLTGNQPPSLQLQASWRQSSRISALKTSLTSSQQAILAAANVSGSMCFIVTKVIQPSTSSSPIFSSPLHKGVVSGIDLQADTKDCVSVGEDGKINLVQLAESQLRHRCIFDYHGLRSFTATQWASPVEFVTAGVGFSLQWWDHRRPGGASQTTSKWMSGSGAGSIHSLDVHLSRKHVCVVGGSDGVVLAWDLRWQQEPIQLSGPSSLKRQASGGSLVDSDVWEVKYDPWTFAASKRSVSSKIPPVMICSEDGILGVLEAGEAAWEILAEPCAINTFDINPESGSDIICGLDFESLVYLRRSL